MAAAGHGGDSMVPMRVDVIGKGKTKGDSKGKNVDVKDKARVTRICL